MKYFLVGAGSIIVVLLIGMFVKQTMQNQAPKVASAGNVAGVSVSETSAPEELKNDVVSFDTCPPGRNGDISLDTINSKPEPTVFDEKSTNTGGTLGLVMEAQQTDINNESMPPSDLKVTKLQNGFVQGSWTHNGVTLKQFNVYLKGPTGGWIMIGKIPRSTNKQYSFVDQTVRNEGKFYYAVSVLSASGKESDCSAPGEIN